MSKFSDNLKRLRKEINFTQEELAKALNVTKSRINMYECGEREPNFEMLESIADYFNVDMNYLLGETDVKNSKQQDDIRKKYDSIYSNRVKKIPVLGEVAAGFPMFAEENIIDYEEIPAERAKNDDYFALKIHGDSMEPRIWNNDVVIVRKQSDVDSGDIAIVIVNGDLGTCKKVVKHSSGISLISFNSKYEPMFYTFDDIKTLPLTIIGKVVELRGKL